MADWAQRTRNFKGDNVSIEPGQMRAPLAYESTWAVAMALNNTLTELMANGGS
jgi:hypothetical protein